MDSDVPPTNTCLKLRPWLHLSAWLYVVLAFIRLRDNPWDSFSYFIVAVLGINATLKSLRMNLVFFYMVLVTLFTLSDLVQVSTASQSWAAMHAMLRAGGFAAVRVVGFVAAPIVGAVSVLISFWMTRDYADAVEVRADEERRMFLAAVTGIQPARPLYGTSASFEPFSGRGRYLGSIDSD